MAEAQHPLRRVALSFKHSSRQNRSFCGATRVHDEESPYRSAHGRRSAPGGNNRQGVNKSGYFSTIAIAVA